MADAAPATWRPRVLVTRPQPQADGWVSQLQALGTDAVAVPLLGIDGPADPAQVQAAIQALPGCALAMFVSPSAVAQWRAQAPPGWQWPAGALAGSTGPGTQAALLRAGVPAQAIVSPAEAEGQFDSEALWALLKPLRPWVGTQVQVVRGEGGRDWLAEALRAAGAQVHFVAAYRRTAPVLLPLARQALDQALTQPARHWWLLSSSEAAGQLPALAPGADWSAAQALATHPRIAQAARAIGFGAAFLVAPAVAAVHAAVQAAVAEEVRGETGGAVEAADGTAALASAAQPRRYNAAERD